MAKSRRVLPPVYFLLALVMIGGLHWLLPIKKLIPTPLSYLGLVPVVIGIGLAAAGVRLFARTGTTIKPFEESAALVTEGVFRYTRNPMYLGMVFVLLGCAILAGTAIPFVVAPGFLVLIERRFIRAEEAMLTETFGSTYTEYQRRVRRWL